VATGFTVTQQTTSTQANSLQIVVLYVL